VAPYKFSTNNLIGAEMLPPRVGIPVVDPVKLTMNGESSTIGDDAIWLVTPLK
jgi:hypothetical protein